MANTQKMIRMGMLEEKKQRLHDVTVSLRSRIDSIAVMIMPEMDIEDQQFESAQSAINACISLKKDYDQLQTEIKKLKEAL